MVSSPSSSDDEDQITTVVAPAGQEPHVLDKLETAYNSLLDKMTAPEFFTLFSHVRQPFVDGIAAIQNLREYRTTHPDESSEMLTFTTANKSTYDRLGLTINTIQWQESHYNKLNESFVERQMKEKICQFWDEKGELLTNQFKGYKMYWTKSSAATASVRFLFFLLESLYQEDLDLVPLVLPNMKLDVESDDPVILSCTPEAGPKRTTLVSGTAEMAYTFFAKESGLEFRQGQTIEEKEELQRIDPLHFEDLIVDPNHMGLFKDECFLQFAIYDKPIRSKVPQIITVCLAIMQMTNKKKIAWCLTSGTKWIFGVLVDGPSRTCYLTDVLRLSLSNEGNNLNTIFMTLAYWGMSSCQDIIKLFA